MEAVAFASCRIQSRAISRWRSSWRRSRGGSPGWSSATASSSIGRMKRSTARTRWRVNRRFLRAFAAPRSSVVSPPGCGPASRFCGSAAPHELIEKLAALVPKPRVNLLLYHGVLGPSARLRSAAVARALCLSEAAEVARAQEDDTVPRSAVGTLGPVPTSLRDRTGSEALLGSTAPGPRNVDESPGRSQSQPRPHTPWAELLRRTFEIDILACAGCGGRLRLLATIEDPAVVRKILSHLGVPSECPQPLPARSPPSSPELFDFRHDLEGDRSQRSAFGLGRKRRTRAVLRRASWTTRGLISGGGPVPAR
jgi:hypothetical protein